MQNESLLISSCDAAALIGIGKTLFYQLASDGRLGPEPIDLAGKRMYLRSEIIAWIENGRCCPRETWAKMSPGTLRLMEGKAV